MQCCPPLLPSLQSVDLVCSDGSVRPTGRGTGTSGGYQLLPTAAANASATGSYSILDWQEPDCPGGYDMARSRLRRAPYERLELFLR